MSKQTRLLDIDSCNRCKHLDFAKSGIVGYVICRKENKVITDVDGYRMDMLLEEVKIPEWCTLPIVGNENNIGD